MYRRQCIHGLGVGLLGLCHHASSHGKSQESSGCALLINKDRVGKVVDVARGIGIVDGVIDNSTGNRVKDRALGRALVRLSQLFQERPSFGFIDDGSQPNAFATDEIRVAGTWGSVLFGRRLFQELDERYDDGGMAVLCIMAHEFAHIAQFRTKTYSTLVGAGRKSKRAELHADLLSGYYLGIRKAQVPSLQLRSAGVHLFEIGDFEFNDRDHHGTPSERIEAAEKGFTLAKSKDSSFRNAFDYGLAWVLEKHAS
jgi:hypothetical protein